MPKYYVKTACFHGDRFWAKGEVHDVAEGVKLPRHFVLNAPKERAPITEADMRSRASGPKDFISVIRSRPREDLEDADKQAAPVENSKGGSAKGK